LGLWIAVLSGVAWAGLDVTRKSLTERHSAAVIATGLALGSAALFAVGASVSALRIELQAYLIPGLISIALSISTQLLILESVKRSELSRTIPLLSFTPVATSLFGAAVLQELPSPTEWTGIGLVFCGALALGLSRSEGRSRFPTFDAGALLMLLAAVSISAAAPFDKLAVEASTTLLHGLIQALGGAVVLLCFLAARGELRQLGAAFRQRPAMTGAAFLAFAAIGLQFLAYRSAMVGEVETIKRVVGLIASLGTGLLVFGERITLLKTTAVVVLGVGTALMLLGAAG
jgi:drug/metabolite transporter (DMT)-like permease